MRAAPTAVNPVLTVMADIVNRGKSHEGAEMSDNDSRMQEYERQEQDFLQFANQSRRSREEPPTPEYKPTLAPSKGLQCLLALSKLLEKTIKVKLAELNSEKDWEDLHELRRYAEKMGHVDHKIFHATNSAPPSFHMESTHEYDDLSITEEPRLPKVMSKLLGDVEHLDQHKAKSLRVGTQMLSGTIGRVRTKLISGRDTVRDKVFHPSSSSSPSSSSFAHRKLKSQEDLQTSYGISALVRASSNELLSNFAGSNPAFSQVDNTKEYEKALFNRQLSDITQTTQEPAQLTDRFVSLPNDLELVADQPKPGADVDRRLRERSTRRPEREYVSYRTSYEEAVLPNGPLNFTLTPAEQSQVDSGEAPELGERTVNQTQHLREQEYQINLNQIHLSKDFTKKFEKWVAKSKNEPKENHSRSGNSSNQSAAKIAKKKGGRRGGFNRQRSMSADRAGLLASKGNDEFEEKLRQWGIKQAHDPDYYLETRRRSRDIQRSAESPARLSRQEELPSPQHPQWTEMRSQQQSVTPIAHHRPVSIERGRRVSPSRTNRYSRTSLQQSPRGSIEAISSSSSGSINLNSQLSPGSTSGHGIPGIRSVSAESLQSTDESGELDEENRATRSSAKRPLSMICMPGSLESPESLSPMNSLDADSHQLNPSNGKEVLKTINEDINRIRETRVHCTDSSSESSLERSLQRGSTPNRSLLAEGGHSPEYEVIHDQSPHLPSHSICVDSGLVMEEGKFCDLETIPQTDQSIDKMALLDRSPESTNNEIQITVPNLNNSSNFSDFNSNKCLHSAPNGLTLRKPNSPSPSHGPPSDLSNLIPPESFKTDINLFAPDGQVQLNNQAESLSLLSNSYHTTGPDNHTTGLDYHTTEPDNHTTGPDNHTTRPDIHTTGPDNHTTEPDNHTTGPDNHTTEPDYHPTEPDNHPTEPDSLKSANRPQSVSENDVFGCADLSNMIREEATSEVSNVPLEPLLSSQSVSLRTKLHRLSTLYDCDDGEDLKIKQEEPSGPYDVFKPPKKYLHSRSRSDDRLLCDFLDDQEFSTKPRRRGSEESMTEQKSRMRSNNATSALTGSARQELFSALTGSARQISPVVLRRKLNSPVPVLDLVHRFDSQIGESPTLLNSPVPTSCGTPQMPKITERLLQQNRANKQRYTVDLTRHVREIPKEGAVQRARSIFMDMQRT